MLEPVRVRCRIPELLDKIGKNQAWLSDRTGIQETRLSEIIHMKVVNPGLDRLKHIADTLNVYIDDLYEWRWQRKE